MPTLPHPVLAISSTLPLILLPKRSNSQRCLLPINTPPRQPTRPPLPHLPAVLVQRSDFEQLKRLQELLLLLHQQRRNDSMCHRPPLPSLVARCARRAPDQRPHLLLTLHPAPRSNAAEAQNRQRPTPRSCCWLLPSLCTPSGHCRTFCTRRRGTPSTCS